MGHRVEEIDKLVIGELKINRFYDPKKSHSRHKGSRHKLRELKHELRHLQHEVTKLQHEVHHLNHEIHELQEAYQALQAQITTLQAENAALQGQVQSLQTTVAQLQVAVASGIAPNPALQSVFAQLTGQIVTISTPGGNVTGTVVEAGDDAVLLRESNGDQVIIPYSKISAFFQGGM